jgi:hypothetical protein
MDEKTAASLVTAKKFLLEKLVAEEKIKKDDTPRLDLIAGFAEDDHFFFTIRVIVDEKWLDTWHVCTLDNGEIIAETPLMVVDDV